MALFGRYREVFLLTIVYGAKAAIPKFSIRIEIVSGFYELIVGEDMNSKVSDSSLLLLHL